MKAHENFWHYGRGRRVFSSEEAMVSVIDRDCFIKVDKDFVQDGENQMALPAWVQALLAKGGNWQIHASTYFPTIVNDGCIGSLINDLAEVGAFNHDIYFFVHLERCHMQAEDFFGHPGLPSEADLEESPLEIFYRLLNQPDSDGEEGQAGV